MTPLPAFGFRPALAAALALGAAACSPEASPGETAAANRPAEQVTGQADASQNAAKATQSNKVEPTEAEAEPQSACLIQDGTRVAVMAIKAIGTEPFWAAEVKGRCVTYSTPEDQDGTRVWTQFSGTAEHGTWTGALDGQRFVMVTRPQAGCSDGMSDNRYPIAVTLTVGGEERRGCAEPRS